MSNTKQTKLTCWIRPKSSSDVSHKTVESLRIDVSGSNESPESERGRENIKNSNSDNLPEKEIEPESDVISEPVNSRKRCYVFSEDWIQKFTWIEKSDDGKVFCKICKESKRRKLFLKSTQIQERFISEGFSNWKKAIEKFKQHEKSQQHVQAVTSITALQTTSVSNLDVNRVNKLQAESRIALKALVTSTVFLASQGLAFQGHEKRQGNYEELLNLRSTDVPELKSFLQRKKPFTAPEIQNDILKIISHAILRKQISFIKNRKYFSLIVDETTDISGREQISICIRTVSNDLEVFEDFLGFYETDSTTADSIFSIIIDVMRRFELNKNYLRGQCYDGASNMSGIHNGVAVKMQNEEPKCLYVHCYAHCLNLVIQDVVKGNHLLRDCLSYVNDVGVLLKGSAKRLALYEALRRELDEDNSSTLKPQPVCATRWTVRGKNVKAIIQNYELVLNFLYELGTSKDKVSSKAYGLYTVLSKGETFYGLLVLRAIIIPTEGLSRVIQAQKATAAGIISAAKVTIEAMRSIKASFTEIWAEMVVALEKFDLEIPKQKRLRKVPKRFAKGAALTVETPEKRLENILVNAIDTVVSEMRSRFDQPGIRKIQELEELILNWKTLDKNVQTFKVRNIAAEYGFDCERLETQVKMVHEIPNIDCSSTATFVSSFKALLPEVRELFQEIRELLKILIVVPISSATAERSFSMLRRIKDYLRSTMTQARLNHCAIVHLYKEMAKELDVEIIMNEFVNNKLRRDVFGEN